MTGVAMPPIESTREGCLDLGLNTLSPATLRLDRSRSNAGVCGVALADRCTGDGSRTELASMLNEGGPGDTDMSDVSAGER